MLLSAPRLLCGNALPRHQKGVVAIDGPGCIIFQTPTYGTWETTGNFGRRFYVYVDGC
jgi:hypothetical protein